MAGQIITLTQGPIVVAGTYTMDATQALDVLGSGGGVTLFGRVYSLVASSPTLSLTIQTSMTNVSDSITWADIGTENFASSGGAAPTYAAKVDNTGKLLRYVRYVFTATGVTSGVIEVTGVLW